MPGWIGPWELLILLLVVLLIFGPRRLPEMGRSLGKGMREFKNSISGRDGEGSVAEIAAEINAAVTEDEPEDEPDADADDEPDAVPASTRERDSVA